ncbi:hypothetical protein GC176_26125, partial [bacterium]|nr:hypothetical protein [bacterium]
MSAGLNSANTADTDDPFEGFERSFMERYPGWWSLTLFGPLVLSVLLLGIHWLLAGPEETRRLLIMAAASLWLFGRFVILGGSDPDVGQVTGAMTSLELFAMVLYLDVTVALLLAFHIGFLFRLPVIGKRLRAVIIDGQFLLNQHPWVRRATFLGLAVFVAFPLTATGSVGGSVLGRLLGLSRRATFLGIVLGSLIGNGLMLLASEFIGEYFNKDH